MTFIIILLALLIERFLDWSHLRLWGWLPRYQRFLQNFGSYPPSNLYAAIFMAIPLLGVVSLNHLLSGLIFNLVQLIFEILVLLYCLGPENLWGQAYLSISLLNTKDHEVPLQQVLTALHVPFSGNPQELYKNLITSFFLEAETRIFAVVFWFALLGPMGAGLYRLADLCVRKYAIFTPKMKIVLDVLDWLPVRFFAICLALGGHFSNVLRIFKQKIYLHVYQNEEFLTDCSLAALDLQPMPDNGLAGKEAIGLIDRAFIILLVFLALIVLL
jgi:AmpE protein